MHCRRWTAGQVILGVTNVAIFVSARPSMSACYWAGGDWQGRPISRWSRCFGHELGRRAWDHLDEGRRFLLRRFHRAGGACRGGRG